MKYVAVDVHLSRTVRHMIAREKIGGGLVTICELRTPHDRDEVLEALNKPLTLQVELPRAKRVA